MDGWGNWVDLEFDDEEMADRAVPTLPEKPQYPYGLRISLCGRELEKLGLPLPEVGNMIDMRAFGCVTSVSDDGTPDGQRVEIQLQRIRVENEDDEEGEEGGEGDELYD